MRNRSPWAVLLVATAHAGGCAAHRDAVPNAVPVHLLPAEVLRPAPPPAGDPNKAVIVPAGSRHESSGAVVPASLEAGPSGESGACAVFYTGGGLGSGEYPLKRDLRVTDAIALVHGPLRPGLISAAPTQVTVLRRVGRASGQPLAILVDLNEARRDPRENIPVLPGDTILTNESGFEATGRVAGQVFRATVRLPVRLLTGGAGP